MDLRTSCTQSSNVSLWKCIFTEGWPPLVGNPGWLKFHSFGVEITWSEHRIRDYVVGLSPSNPQVTVLA